MTKYVIEYGNSAGNPVRHPLKEYASYISYIFLAIILLVHYNIVLTTRKEG